MIITVVSAAALIAGGFVAAGFIAIALWALVCETGRSYSRRRVPRTPACPESDEVFRHRLVDLDAHRITPNQYGSARP